MDDRDIDILSVAVAAMDGLKRRVEAQGDRDLLVAVNAAVIAIHDVCRKVEASDRPLSSA